jgi:hypothetical protein
MLQQTPYGPADSRPPAKRFSLARAPQSGRSGAATERIIRAPINGTIDLKRENWQAAAQLDLAEQDCIQHRNKQCPNFSENTMNYAKVVSVRIS